MVSYVNVDYTKLDEIIKKRGTTRAKCAEFCGIHPGTLANSFSRHSKMKADLVVKLAQFLSVKKVDLLEKDEWGNIRNYDDWEAIASIRLDSEAKEQTSEDKESYSRLVSQFLEKLHGNEQNRNIIEMSKYLDMLNSEGQQKAIEFVSILTRVSEFRKEETENGKS